MVTRSTNKDADTDVTAMLYGSAHGSAHCSAARAAHYALGSRIAGAVVCAAMLACALAGMLPESEHARVSAAGKQEGLLDLEPSLRVRASAPIELAERTDELELNNMAGLNTAGALVQRLREVCPCAISGNTLLSQQALADCPCAAAIAAAVRKALTPGQYGRVLPEGFSTFGASSAPSAPPSQSPKRENAHPAYPPGTLQPLPPSPQVGSGINYMAIIDTLTRDVVSDSNLIADLRRRQQQVLSLLSLLVQNYKY